MREVCLRDEREEIRRENGKRMDSLCTVNNGNTPPATYRINPFAANADAPFSGPYVSTRYNAAAQNTHMFPHPNGIVANTGLIQCTPSRAVHANQNSPIGRPTLPIIAAYSRYSGATKPVALR